MTTIPPVWWDWTAYLDAAPHTLTATVNGTPISVVAGYNLPNRPLEYEFESGWDLYVGDDYGNTVSWVINGNAGSLVRTMGTDYTGYANALIAALLATPTVTTATIKATGYNAGGFPGYGVRIRMGSTGYFTGLVNNPATFENIWLKDRTYVNHPTWVNNLNYTQFGNWYEHNYLKVDRSADLTAATVTVDGVPITIAITSDDSNEEIIAKIRDAIALAGSPAYYRSTVETTINQYVAPIKYTGDIVFSIAALDGIDPVVSVGPTSAQEPFTITTATNEIVELAQVEGISASRGRLLAWDYTNTLYLGSAVDPTDFTPSVTTQANSYRVDAIKGNIVLILPHPEGAVIYSTGNIVKSTYQGGGSQQVFSYRAINEKGAIDPRHIAKGSDSHYLIGSEGLYTVDYSKNEVSLIGKELTDFLKRYKFPIQLQMIGNRYLVVNLLEAPPTVDAKAWREGSATAYQLGEGTRTARPVQVLSIPDVPFGQNLFPLFTNAMIYDAVLDKWGYATLDYKHLFSINPTNQEGYPAEKDYALREAAFYNDVRSLAALLPDGSTVLLNDSPDSSYIVYGKYLLSRSHYTRVLKVEAQFLDYPDCTISLEPSMDGRLIDYDNIKESAAIGTPGFRWPIMAVASWFNILVKGKFNLTGLSIEGKRDGRRP
jgi:hypothetical protein